MFARTFVRMAVVSCVWPLVARAEQVVITRDTWGVAHVQAPTDEGAMFAAGYATAQDRMFQMHRNRRAIQGRLAELVGLMGHGGDTTITQDIDMRHRGFYKRAQRLVPNLDCGTLRLLGAYAAGVNKYLADNAGGLLYLFGAQAPEPWTPVDCLAVWNRVSEYFAGFPANEAAMLHEFEDLVVQLGSVEAAIAAMTPMPIYDESAAVVKQSDLDAATIQAMFDYADAHDDCPLGRAGRLLWPGRGEFRKFSHAWVVGGSKTTTGKPVLHSDPQTAIAAPSLFYEIHVDGATFNARGVGAAGCPGFLIGFNENVAWGMTALGPDLEDLYRLKIVGPDQYEYDGVTRSMSVSNETILVKNGAPVPITVKDTLVGPVVTPLIPAAEVRAGEEYALKAVPQNDTDRHTVRAMFGMMRATDVNSFVSAAGDWRNPGANCVFGDASGSIGYWTLGGLTQRSPCSPLGGFIAQDGGSSQFDWVETIPMNVRPHVMNPASGVLFSGNHEPVGSWYPVALGVGTGGVGDTTRSWRLRERLEESGPATFTPADVLNVHYDNVNPARREIVRAAIHAKDVLGLSFSTAATNAIGVLRNWYAGGAHSTTSHPNYAAAHHISLKFRADIAPLLVAIYGGAENGLCHFLKTLKARLDLNPAASISPAELAYLDFALSAGWNSAIAFYGASVLGWQAAFANGPGTLRVDYFQTLEGFGSLDPAHNQSWPGVSDPDGGTIWSQINESYSHWADLNAIDASLAILPTGMSENPAGAHFDDQAPLLVSGTLRAAPLGDAAVQAIAMSTLSLNYPAPGGDLNGDGAFNSSDISAFVSALLGQLGSGLIACAADVNASGNVDGLDIQPFVSAALGG